MRLLLDTHVFLWYIAGDPRLPASWCGLLQEPDNQVYLSVVSLWEACIKYNLGRLPLPSAPETYLVEQRQRHMIEALPLEEKAVCRLGALAPLHRDPLTACWSVRLSRTT